MNRTALALGVLGLMALAGPAEATAAERQPTAAPPTAVQRLLQCRELGSAEQRLACFDRESSVVANDLSRRELVVIDRGQVASTRRTLFGLTLPRLDILGDNTQDEVRQIESTIAAAGHNREGSWLFALADGSRWSQTDSTVLDLAPRRGEKVTVRRAALGSYVLIVPGQSPMKVKRVQ